MEKEWQPTGSKCWVFKLNLDEKVGSTTMINELL